MRIGIVVGSTRPGRRGLDVARWVIGCAESHRPNPEYELIDLADFGLPLLDEPRPAALGDYRHDHTLRWSRTIAGLDGYVLVTPEYNHSTSAALKNAIDYLFVEWHDKAAGLVGYGVTGGWRAIEALRLVLAEVKVATVRTAVGLAFRHDFVAGEPQPGRHQVAALGTMLDEVVEWGSALRGITR